MFSSFDNSILTKLQHRTDNIRNICILAHVDHGKTTLSDYLLSSNGVISKSLAGKARFLDSRPDEQERKITMKSSSIALVFTDNRLLPSSSSSPSPPPVYLVNLIDSPGHVDFSSEVSTAVRCSDGALVLVDVVEGLCVQTSAVLRTAWREGVKPVLVLNKLDRLIVEVRMSAAEAYSHCFKLIESINAVVATFLTSDAMAVAANQDTGSGASQQQVDIDDNKQVIFGPELGNVLFASAGDCWAFSLPIFATLYSRLLGMNASVLQSCLWGDYFYLPKEKKVVKKPTTKHNKPMAVQLIFDVIWQLYETVYANTPDNEKLIYMMQRVGVQLTEKELIREKDKKRKVQLVMGRWLPIPACVLGCVVDHLPSPNTAQKERLARVWSGIDKPLAEATKLHEAMLQCDSGFDDVIVYISKMVDVGDTLKKAHERKHVRIGVAERKAYVRSKAQNNEEEEEVNEEEPQQLQPSPEEERKEAAPISLPVYGQETERKMQEQDGTVSPSPPPSPLHRDSRFLAFARVFAGTLTTSSTQLLHVYLPRYHPASTEHHVTVPASSLSLYLFMGVDVRPVDEVPAGNVCGIAGLDELVLRTATLSSVPPPLSPFQSMSFQSSPIMRVAVEPENPNDWSAFHHGLSLLIHADPNVIVRHLPSGETILIVSGELHLERCVRDLHDRFAVGVALRVSEPLIVFRETVIRQDEKKTQQEVDFKLKKEKGKEKKKQAAMNKKRRDDDEGGVDEVAADGVGKDAMEEVQQRRKIEDTRRRIIEAEQQHHSESLASPVQQQVIDRSCSSSPSPAGQASLRVISPAEDDTASSYVDTASSFDPTSGDKQLHKHAVEEVIASKGVLLRIRCVPLGNEVMTVLEEGRTVINAWRKHQLKQQQQQQQQRQKNIALPPDTPKSPVEEENKEGCDQKQDRDSALSHAPDDPDAASSDLNEDEDEDEADEEDALIAARCSSKFSLSSLLSTLRSLFGSPSCPDLQPLDVDRIWAFGPKHVGPNLFINRTDLAAASTPSSVDPSSTSAHFFTQIQNGLLQGFQLVCQSGPMCEEPLMGCAFVLEEFTFNPTTFPLSGELISMCRSACRRAFLTHSHHLRLLEAVYLVELQCSVEELGHLYPVLSRRRGRIIHEDLKEGTNLFLITAYLPTAESFGFATEVRKKTGGEAQPQLIFSHWELIPQDPYHVPRTEEEIERAGMFEEGRNVAKQYVERVRKRKGLFVTEKVVQHAEKQRTLAKKK